MAIAEWDASDGVRPDARADEIRALAGVGAGKLVGQVLDGQVPDVQKLDASELQDQPEQRVRRGAAAPCKQDAAQSAA